MQKAKPRAGRTAIQRTEVDEGLEVLKAIVMRMQTEHEAALNAIGAWYDQYVAKDIMKAKPDSTIITPN